MSTPGDDEQVPHRPPDPFQTPSGGDVDQPRFGDGGTDAYAPGYHVTGSSPESSTAHPNVQPPPPVAGGHTRQTPPPPAPALAPAATDSRRGLIAPIAAGIVLIGGIVLLIWSSGSDEPEPITTPRIAEVGDPDEPVVESTVPSGSLPTDSGPETTGSDGTDSQGTVAEVSVPMMTSPPLVEPTTSVPDETDATVADTTTPGTGGPSQAMLDAALLGLNDIGSGDWVEDVPDFDEVCDTVADAADPELRADALFTTVIPEPLAVRQISNTLITYATPELAERAFTADLDELIACDATTVDFDGDQYRVQVNNSAFTEEQAAAFPCANQTSFLILQLINDEAAVPYIGQSAVAFRCGRNVTVTALTTTIDLADLDDENFFDAAAISNSRTGALPGS